MTTAKLEQEYRRIVKKDTKLDAQEQVALLNLYVNLNDAAELALDRDMIEMNRLKVQGAIEYLTFMGKIQDDEDLHMTLNELEADADRNRARIEDDQFLAKMKRNRQIREMRADGAKFADIGKKFGMSASRAQEICREAQHVLKMQRQEEIEKRILQRRARENAD